MSLHPTSKPDTCYGGGVLLYRRIEGLLRRVRAYFALSTSPAPLRLLISSRRKPGVAIVKIRATGDEVEVRGQSTDREVLLEIFGAETWELPFEPARKPRWVIDAGANVGYGSIYFARKFPTAMVIALEPEPNNFSQLVRNTSSIPNIRPVQAALWSADCLVALEDPGKGDWAFRVKETGQTSAVTIAARSLKSLIDEHGIDRVDILKVDIEGGERHVFEECDPWIDSVDLIGIELHDRLDPGSSEAFWEASRGFQQQVKRGHEVFLVRGNAE